jgi:hypothetical protein
VKNWFQSLLSNGVNLCRYSVDDANNDMLHDIFGREKHRWGCTS